ncbi:MAG: cytochrome-c peroxidase [Planctomycetes bacterium]|nr:cytochrome-c peroxidase [Planctomycetota bacterium]
MRTLAVLTTVVAAMAQELPVVPAAEAPPAPAFAFLVAPPRGLPPMPLPADYAPTEVMFALGQRLFHDGILSRDRTVSCVTCHPAATGFASPEPRPAGVQGRRAKRHAPALWNRGYGTLQRWDGSSPSLEAFVLEPIADANEMDLPLAAALARLRGDADYRREFAAAFGGEPTALHLQRSLATFVRGIVAGDAPYDRFLRGDVGALTPAERSGLWVFESKGACWRCHVPPLFTDERFHNTGVGACDGVAEPGRAAATGEAADTGRWKTPTLRGVRLTAPYMHDGSLATLEDVVAFYAQGGTPNAHLDARVQPLPLTEVDRRNLVAFLRSL